MIKRNRMTPFDITKRKGNNNPYLISLFEVLLLCLLCVCCMDVFGCCSCVTLANSVRSVRCVRCVRSARSVRCVRTVNSVKYVNGQNCNMYHVSQIHIYILLLGRILHYL